jgi:hypothetical protein
MNRTPEGYIRRASGGTGVFAGGKIMPSRGSPPARVGIPRLAPATAAVVIFKNRRREVLVTAGSLAVLIARRGAETSLLGKVKLLKICD